MNQQPENEPIFSEPASAKVKLLVSDYLKVGSELIAIMVKLGGYLSILESQLGQDEFTKWVVGILPERKARYLIDNYKALTSGGNWEVSWRLDANEKGQVPNESIP
jgi:hypothetical protein